jgi:hypothetical protein
VTVASRQLADPRQLHQATPTDGICRLYEISTMLARFCRESASDAAIIAVMLQSSPWKREQGQPSPATAETASGSPAATEMPDRTRRIRFRLLRGRLDGQIAAEAPPRESVDIRRRCAELTARGSRLCLASALDNILDAADERQGDPASALILDHEAVLHERDPIEELIKRLRSSEAVSARSVALTRLLVHDSHGPLYRHRDDKTLGDALAKIAGALSCGRASG